MLRERVELEMIPNLTHFITMYEDIFFMKHRYAHAHSFKNWRVGQTADSNVTSCQHPGL